MNFGRPRKPTQMFRATVSQEIRVIVPAEEGDPAGWRRVHVLAPMEPKMMAALDTDPEVFGLNRVYKLSDLPPGNMIPFVLMPGQFIVAACAEGLAEASIIVEYLE